MPPSSPLVAGALDRLGAVRALVVHGADGSDELSLAGPNLALLVDEGETREVVIDAIELGLDRASLSAIAGGDAQLNAAIALSVLGGEPGPTRDVVVLNAGAALFVAGVADSVREGISLAREAIDSGRARRRRHRRRTGGRVSVLEPLLAASRARARRDARVTPLRELRRQVATMPPAPRFEAALRYADRLAIVAEIKRASPSVPAFPAVGAGAPAAAGMARTFADAGATALSVLTEPTRFAGTDDDLARHRAHRPSRCCARTSPSTRTRSGRHGPSAPERCSSSSERCPTPSSPR